MAENEKATAAAPEAAPVKKAPKPVSPGTQALRDVVSKVYAAAWDAKKAGRPVGWSSSKFPCEIAEALGLAVVYPENQAAGIGAQHDGQRMCEAAESLGFDPDICGYARISLAYAAGVETTNESRRVPAPDFVLCCNNICNCMGQAGIVSLASMLVVFSVLLLLYVILVIFGKIATRNLGKAPASPAAPSAAPAAAPKQDDSELIAVLSAAVAEYERTRDNPFVRNRQDLD